MLLLVTLLPGSWSLKNLKVWGYKLLALIFLHWTWLELFLSKRRKNGFYWFFEYVKTCYYVLWRQSGTRNTLTGVGLSIGYPTKDKSTSGLIVVSAAPGGPAYRAGVLSGDLILAIDDKSTENMEIYDAADRLQWVSLYHMADGLSEMLVFWWRINLSGLERKIQRKSLHNCNFIRHASYHSI